jgi:hypothetical protein
MTLGCMRRVAGSQGKDGYMYAHWRASSLRPRFSSRER